MQRLLLAHTHIEMPGMCKIQVVYGVDLFAHTCLFLKRADALSIEDLSGFCDTGMVIFKDASARSMFLASLQRQNIRWQLQTQINRHEKSFFEGFLNRFLCNRYFACSTEGLEHSLDSVRQLYNRQYDCR